MDEKLYSVEQVSELLDIHPKTTRKYIREGKLKANKVGKLWRITGHDLSVFVEGNNISIQRTNEDNCISLDKGEQSSSHNKITVSSVIDIIVKDKDEGDRISNTLIAVMNSKDPQYGKSTISIQYFEGNKKIRVLLWGSVYVVETILSCLSLLIEQNE